MSMTKIDGTNILVKEHESFHDGLYDPIVTDPRETTSYMKWLKKKKDIPSGQKLYRGEAIIGTEPHKDPRTGRTTLGNVIARKHNIVLMAGTLYGLEKMFNTPASLSVDYLNTIMGIGTTGPAVTEKYERNHAVCLWSIGNGACGDSFRDVTAMLQQNRQLLGMIPFRVVDEPFEEHSPEGEKYWFRKINAEGKSEYYLKTFDDATIISALWKDAGNGKDGSAVVPQDYSATKTTPIETFAECQLRLDEEDLMEYYTLIDKVDEARFNTFGLCTGLRSTTADGAAEYKQVLQVTALSFSNEMLHMGKALTIIYRWYTA